MLLRIAELVVISMAGSRGILQPPFVLTILHSEILQLLSRALSLWKPMLLQCQSSLTKLQCSICRCSLDHVVTSVKTLFGVNIELPCEVFLSLLVIVVELSPYSLGQVIVMLFDELSCSIKLS